jgi:3-oxoacyl-[acyl-carrier-protein] synthase-1
MPFMLSNLGIVSALGCGADETFSRMMAGDTFGLRQIPVPAGEGSTYFGFAPDEVMSPDNVAKSGSRVGTLIDEALRQMGAGIDALLSSVSTDRVGVVVGTSCSTMEEFTDNPDVIDMAYPALRVKSRLGIGGPVWSVSTACSSSAKVFSSARRLMASGVCDAVLVGGADAFTRTVVGGFGSLEALSQRPTRPLSADRDGLSLGEGAAFFIMRRAKDGGEGVALLGVGESSDAYHPTAPDPEGRGAEAAMRAALDDAWLSPKDIDYVNLHGTGTMYNDDMECAAVRRLFGANVFCSSTKSMTGHTLGAAGAIDAALCYLSLESGAGMPPQATSPVDSAIAPFRVPMPGNSLPLRTVLSNSFAFGGSNAAIALGKVRP